MREEYGRKSRQSAGGGTRGSHSKRSIFRRTVFLMAVCGVLMFIPLFWKLWNIAIVNHDYYQQLATKQQTLDLSVSSSRGNIYDRNGNVLAMSATVYNLILSPNDLEKSVSKKDFTDEEGNLDQAAYEAAVAAKQDQMVRDLMALVPGLDEERVDTQVHATKYSYREIKKNIEEEEAQAIREYITENKTSAYLYLTPGTKRYYPYSGLAAQALGFVNDEGGAYGIEAAYNDVLEGTAGRVVTTKTGAGTQMYNAYSDFVDAIDGYDLTLTIDATIQSYLEKTIEEGIQDYDVRNGAFAIAMDPNTGAVLGIASSPDFDPNNYSKILDDMLNGKMDENTQAIYEQLKADNPENLTDAELMAQAESQAYSQAVMSQWRSKAIDDTYEPGSTFKALVLAAALEEGVVSESDTFYCSGSVKIADHTIHCSKVTGHGSQTLAEAVGNSCNPAFINMGQRIGSEKYYEYMKAFGLAEKTGVDMVGEVSGILNESGLKSDPAALASYSFGQTFNVTPLELIRAQAACINGGYLYTPYVVEQELDDEGGVVYQHEAVPVRQVISEETSAVVRECLEYVVAKGGGKNGQVAGYRIGGKTGTADKTGTRNTTREVVVSFMCFAPADDPQYIMLLTMDTPSRSTGTPVFGGTMVAPVASSIMADILPALGVEPDYTADELSGADTAVPNVVGKSAADAKSRLEAAGFACRTVGSGDTVTDQTPAGGAIVPGNASIVLYLGAEKPDTPVKVPNVVGRTAAEANRMLTNAGLIMKVSGTTSTSSGNVKALSQNLKEGAEVPAGTVVTVQFGDSSVLD